MIYPRSISGDYVEGSALVRDIYSDEAGTSGDPDERVSVVVGLIVHADTQWRPVVMEMGRLIQNAVPAEYLPAFALHAKDFFKKNKYPNWPRAERNELLKRVMQIPMLFNIPVSVGVVKRGHAGIKPREGNGELVQNELDHLMAWTLCMGGADSFLRGQCDSELARIIAEDLPDMKKFLTRAFLWLRQNSLDLPEQPLGQTELITRSFKIRKIVDHPLYADRYASPLLQLADACAFGFKRFFGQYSYGDEYAKHLIGEELAQTILAGRDWHRFHTVFVRASEVKKPPVDPSSG